MVSRVNHLGDSRGTPAKPTEVVHREHLDLDRVLQRVVEYGAFAAHRRRRCRATVQRDGQRVQGDTQNAWAG